MEVKQVEVRDRGTTIPALAVRVSGGDGPILRRAGFGSPLVILIHLEANRCTWDPYDGTWTGARTMHVAHLWLQENFDQHQNGGVVDVEYILGERSTPKLPGCI